MRHETASTASAANGHTLSLFPAILATIKFPKTPKSADPSIKDLSRSPIRAKP